MKIISGKYKGRTLKGFDIKGTRPTMDRVKESVFAMIQEYIPNSVVLDLFSGSGALAIEALSNNADYAYLVDNNIIAINTIKDNVNMLNIDNVNIIKGDSIKILKDFTNKDIKFDVIFLDPPYNTNLLDKSLSLINNNLNLLNENSIIVCETELNIDYNVYDNLIIFKTRKYCSKVVNILKIK